MEVVRPAPIAVAAVQPVAAPRDDVPRALPLSTWRGATPFGGVPTNDAVETDDPEPPDVDDEGEGIPDIEDRCPGEDNDDVDIDGCPDPEPEVINGAEDGRYRVIIRHQPEVVVTVDGEERRRIILERSEIIIY